MEVGGQRLFALSLYPLTSILFCAVLKLVQPIIEALSCHQFFMGSNLSDPPFMENHDLICMLDGGEAMGDNNRCPPLEQPSQTLLN